MFFAISLFENIMLKTSVFNKKVIARSFMKNSGIPEKED